MRAAAEDDPEGASRPSGIRPSYSEDSSDASRVSVGRCWANSVLQNSFEYPFQFDERYAKNHFHLLGWNENPAKTEEHRRYQSLYMSRLLRSKGE